MIHRCRRLLAAPLLLSSAVTLAACAQSSVSKAPAAPSATEPQPSTSPSAYAAPSRDGDGVMDVEGQATALKDAEAALGRALGKSGEVPGLKAETNPGTPGRMGAEASGDPCMTACIALASMARAASHLCDLAGEGDARCDDARTRVRSATERVRASCSVCAMP